MNLYDKIQTALIAQAVINGSKEQEPQPDLPWPFNYRGGIFFRIIWSVFTMVYINHVAEVAFGMGNYYFSIFWAFLLAYIPIVGSFITPLICIALLLLGIPQTNPNEIHDRLKHLGVEKCYVQQC